MFKLIINRVAASRGADVELDIVSRESAIADADAEFIIATRLPAGESDSACSAADVANTTGGGLVGVAIEGIVRNGAVDVVGK